MFNPGPHSWRFLQLVNVKNVFHGFWASRNSSVVIKKLGYNSELETLDRRLCEAASAETGCNLGEAVTRLTQQVGEDCVNQRWNENNDVNENAMANILVAKHLA